MHKTTKKLTLSAMFIAVGMVLPFLTGQIQQIGNMLLPMHLPVILCGLICGRVWLDMRMAVRSISRFYSSVSAFGYIRDAAFVPYSHCDGI